MPDTKFEIYDAETESSTDKKHLSVFHDYEIKKIVNGNTIFSGKTSLYSILKGKSELPKEDYNYVYDAIIEYLDAHNESIDKTNKSISFKILEIDQRYAAKYEEYMGSFEQLWNDSKSIDIYSQIFFKFVDEVVPHMGYLFEKTLYFSNTGLNLNDENNDITFKDDIIKSLIIQQNSINLFDMYRMDILENIKTGGNSDGS